MAKTSSQCPICGVDQPHGHLDEEITFWIEAQASRFGFRAHPYREGKLPTDLRWWVEEIYTNGQDHSRLTPSDERSIDQWTDELRSWLRHDSPDTQLRPSAELLSQIGFLPTKASER